MRLYSNKQQSNQRLSGLGQTIYICWTQRPIVSERSTLLPEGPSESCLFLILPTTLKPPGMPLIGASAARKSLPFSKNFPYAVCVA
jgi:hypothetical protein